MQEKSVGCKVVFVFQPEYLWYGNTNVIYKSTHFFRVFALFFGRFLKDVGGGKNMRKE